MDWRFRHFTSRHAFGVVALTADALKRWATSSSGLRSGFAAWLALIWLALPVGARDLDCGAAQTTAAMIECVSDAYEAEQALTDQAYAELLGRLSPERAALLRREQKAWGVWRDRAAAFAASAAEGGTLAPILRISEALELTRRRRADLEADLREVE